MSEHRRTVVVTFSTTDEAFAESGCHTTYDIQLALRQVFPTTMEDVIVTEFSAEGDMNMRQQIALMVLCGNYKVPFDPSWFAPSFDLPAGWVQGWIGGDEQKLFVGCDPDGRISS